MKLFIVKSRDNGSYIYATTDKGKADTERGRQELHEEMSGGRPSVYIVETLLVE